MYNRTSSGRRDAYFHRELIETQKSLKTKVNMKHFIHEVRNWHNATWMFMLLLGLLPTKRQSQHNGCQSISPCRTKLANQKLLSKHIFLRSNTHYYHPINPLLFPPQLTLRPDHSDWCFIIHDIFSFVKPCFIFAQLLIYFHFVGGFWVSWKEPFNKMFY